MMLKVRQICGMVVLSSAVLVLSGVPDALAQQKKMTYEQAYRQCKAQLDRTFPPGSQSQTGRNTAGVACMHDLGFRAKKSATF
jgi:hypothetical protein